MKEVTFNAKITVDMTNAEVNLRQDAFNDLVFNIQDLINKAIEEILEGDKTITAQICPVNYKVEE
jgi:hypothetical protein